MLRALALPSDPETRLEGSSVRVARGHHAALVGRTSPIPSSSLAQMEKGRCRGEQCLILGQTTKGSSFLSQSPLG